MTLRAVCSHCSATDHRSSECNTRFGKVHIAVDPVDDLISVTVTDQHARATAKLTPSGIEELTETLRAASIVKERQHV